jgi:hypothetical protein
MMLLTAIGNGSFVFAVFILFWWHPNTALDVRVALAGIYLLITTIAVTGVCVLMRLDASLCGCPDE